MRWIKAHKLILTLLVLSAMGLGYVLLQDRIVGVSIPEVGLQESQDDDDVAYLEALTVLGDIRRISLDTSVFDNADFQSLFDFTRAIDPKPLGRRNPFSPI
jgi:hypothetical protein